MYILRVTDGTTYIDLNNCDKISLIDWTPVVPGPKGNGTWSDSPLAMGRQLVDWQWENWAEVLTLRMVQNTQDKVIRLEQDLHRLLVKANQYWTTDWQNEPVWLEVRAPCETNTRYAIVKGWRTPTGSTNPFQQPFILPEQKSIIDDFQLAIEHGPWLADEPGTGTCVEISGAQDAYPFYLEFDGDTSELNCGSAAAIDNLPNAAYTAEAWIRADSWGEGALGRIFDKSEWFFRVDQVNELYVWASGAAGDAHTRAAAGSFNPDGEWHHVAITFDGVLDFDIWLDGVDVSDAQQAFLAGYSGADAGFDLYIGNELNNAAGFDGGIGWCRISSNIRYNAPFTPPLRCVLPDIDANTVAQWIGYENSGATIDNQEGTAGLDGTQSDCDFGVACEFGRTETCDDEVYIANKHNRAQLTHVFVDDGGAFGGNLIGAATPFNLLPAVPAVNDAAYFGIDTTFDDSGPFCSLVFDIGTAIVQVTTIAWEYWDGAAWSALTVQDNTDADGAMTGVAFDTTGVNSVHWEHPSDWATTAVNGTTGYWVRARVTAIGGAPTAPTQDNRDVYTILWPYVEIADDQVPGDIELTINATYKNTSCAESGSPTLSSTRFIHALRATSRGIDFSPYLNCANEQNPPGLTVVAGGSTTLAAYIDAPTGIAALYNPVGVDAFAVRVQYTFTDALISQYYGKFRAFIRCTQSGGASEDFEVRLGVQFGATTGTSSTAVVNGTVVMEVLDMGTFQFPSWGVDNIAGSELLSSGVIEIEASNTNASPGDLYIIDLILLPVDENAIEALYIPATVLSYQRELSIDSVLVPKSRFRTMIFDTSDDAMYGVWQPIASSGVILQANADQRIWTFAMKHSGAWPSSLWTALHEVSHSVQIIGNARYLYARGDR